MPRAPRRCTGLLPSAWPAKTVLDATVATAQLPSRRRDDETDSDARFSDADGSLRAATDRSLAYIDTERQDTERQDTERQDTERQSGYAHLPTLRSPRRSTAGGSYSTTPSPRSRIRATSMQYSDRCARRSRMSMRIWATRSMLCAFPRAGRGSGGCACRLENRAKSSDGASRRVILRSWCVAGSGVIQKLESGRCLNATTSRRRSSSCCARTANSIIRSVSWNEPGCRRGSPRDRHRRSM